MSNPGILKFNRDTNARNRTAIVFVHGFSGDQQGTWGRIPEFLMAAQGLRGWDLLGFGYQSRKRFDILGLWSSDAAIEEIAVKLWSAPELSKNNYDTLALVAHSMGGLVVQQALVRNEELRQRTTHLLLFGTPSEGLVKASLLSILKQQMNNMSASGPFIRDLRQHWKDLALDTAPPFRFLTIAGEMDQFVPPDSSLHPFPEATHRVIAGNHLTMLDVASQDDACVQIIVGALTEGAALAGPRNSARVAVEAGHFQQVIDKLWPNRDSLDDVGAVQLAIALDRKGRRDDAIETLRKHKPAGTDVYGVLAGRLKRRWLVTRAEADFASACELYNLGYSKATSRNPPDHDQAYYHGINIAFLALAGSVRDDHAARDMAAKVLTHCDAAVNPTQTHWCLATRGDALILLGRVDEGIQIHKQAAAKNLKPWEALSMEEQAIRLADLCA
ncbi:MAG: alpha/beta hydrolase, partial [Bryobacteraceae bacterium]|nr:alpha/beta hydrolase [Bryobacteraceae bacterium]